MHALLRPCLHVGLGGQRLDRVAEVVAGPLDLLTDLGDLVVALPPLARAPGLGVPGLGDGLGAGLRLPYGVQRLRVGDRL